MHGHTKILKTKGQIIMYFPIPGVYAPLTTDGNIMVDGVLASCYPFPFPDHDVAHLGMTPIHWFPHIVEWVLGGEENGFPLAIKVAENMERWFLGIVQK